MGWLMSGASVEEVLGLWSDGLREVKSRLRPLFALPSVAESATAFLDGLLGSERRKTGWMRAEAAGDPGPWRQQAVLGRSRWDVEAAARRGARVRCQELGGAGCGAGDRRNRLSEAGESLVRRGPSVHRLGGKDHKLSDWRVRRLRFHQGARLHRSSALSAESLDRGAGAFGRSARAAEHTLRHQAAARD